MADGMFNIDFSQLEGMVGKFGLMGAEVKVGLLETLEKGAIIMQSLGRQQAPARSGKLRASINYKITDSPIAMKAVIAPNAKYANIVESGRKEVYPVQKKVLATKINPGWGSRNAGGYYIIGTRSKAVAPNPYMERAYHMGEPLVIEEFEVLRKTIISKATA